ncbi:MAG: hypothetical protein PHH37_09830 [Paludibacter sp.]|nr:hypothetical protein [Paludibacter sp.]
MNIDKITNEGFYKNMWKKTGISGNLTFIEIGDKFSVLTQGDQSEMPTFSATLQVGSTLVAERFFAQYPPTASEVENAITFIEDAIMLYHKKLSSGSKLITSDSNILEIARFVIPVKRPETVLAATDIEIIFGRISAIVSGRPASQDILPSDNKFIARLLILREILAHLKFCEITILV